MGFSLVKKRVSFKDREKEYSSFFSGRSRASYSHSSLINGTINSISSVSGSGDKHSYYKSNRKLMPSQLYKLYVTTPDVRACIDSIVRRVATWDWMVVPDLDPRDVNYSSANELASFVSSELSKPNSSGNTFQEVLTKLVTDILVYDSGVLEIVRENGVFKELACFLGSEYFPIQDEHGVVVGYEQEPESPMGSNSKPVSFAKEDVVQFKLFSNTRSPIGMPLLETIINECITVLLAHEHAMLSLDADEIPPGLLILGGIAGAAADRARADLSNMKGKDHKIRVLMSAQPDAIQAKWLELRKTPKDLQLLEVVQQLRKTIWRVFGVMPIEMGETANTPRATSISQLDVASSHLITPILELIQAKINAFVLPLVVGDEELSKIISFKWDRTEKLKPDAKLAESRMYGEYLKRGVITVNEVRKKLGFLPVEGGDTPIVETNIGPIPLTEVAEGVVAEIYNENVNEPSSAETKSFQYNNPVPQEKRGMVKIDLPSEWQDEYFFKNERTLNLKSLGNSIIGYTQDISIIYEDTSNSIISFLSSIPEGTSEQYIKSKIDDMLSSMVDKWYISSLRHYRSVAKSARDMATNHVGIGFDWEKEYREYHVNAMGYLDDGKGIVSSLREELHKVVSDGFQNRAIWDGARDAANGALDKFKSIAHRISNWAGKLIDLGYRVWNGFFKRSGQEWYVMWVHVGDKRMCSDCAREGGSSLRKLSELQITPSNGTSCGAKCRCVLLYYTEKEAKEKGLI
tara:strand:- start:39106 stop:41340 length:2235 start_codon:yes stop_codon:yes gene_type:complete